MHFCPRSGAHIVSWQLGFGELIGHGAQLGLKEELEVWMEDDDLEQVA